MKSTRENDPWKTVALSFAAGAASVSLVWYTRDRTRRRRRRVNNNNNTDMSDDERRGLHEQSTATDSANYNYHNNQNSNNNHSLRHSPSFIDTVKQSVEDAVEDIRSRIGELPAGMVTRTHWPWETIHKNKQQQPSSSSSSLPLPDGPMKLTPENSEPVPENPELCIGSIFGLDVGGTLAKLVYFEQRQDSDMELPKHGVGIRERLYHRAASAQAVIKARRGHPQSATHNGHHHHHHLPRQHNRSASMVERPLRERSFSSGLLRRKLSTASDNCSAAVVVAMEMDSKEHRQPGVHTVDSNDDLENLYRLRQESVPDDLNAFATSVHYNTNNTLPPPPTKFGKDGSDLNEKHQTNHAHFEEAPAREGLQRSTSSGETTGGGMKKSRSMFDLSISQKSKDHAEALNRFYHFARKLDTYREGVKDHKLSFYSRALGGEFHFIRFETRRMENAMELIRANDLHLTIREMGATGGGAHKYAADWERILGIEMKKQEELDSLVAGMQFVLSTVVGECYTFRPRKKSQQKDKPGVPTSSSSFAESDDTPVASPTAHTVNASSSTDTESDQEKKGAFSFDESDSEEGGEEDRDGHGTDEWWWSRKVQRDAISYSSAYPYLLVTIGTGVSILRVDGPQKHERISGSTIGGGTYWGLIRLLTDLEDFDDVMRLAEHGDPSKVDMMVGDIYGNNKEALEKLGLPASLVASSFGKLVAREDPAAGLKQEDLARALLLMVTNNIGQVAYLNAQLHKTNRIYFVGNFLRGNKLSQRRLSFAINYWSKGEMEALFLEHEGYFGALGAFLLSQDISTDDLEPPKRQRRDSDKKKGGDDERPSSRQHRRSQTLEDLF